MGRSNVWYADQNKNKEFVQKVMQAVNQLTDNKETDDEMFQYLVQSANEVQLPKGPVKRPEARSTQIKQWPKDPGISKTVLRQSGYLCQVDQSHKTFKSKVTSENFVEAHHLIPISVQDEFEHSLDVPCNILGLCPNCHRLLHFGSNHLRKPIIKDFFEFREGELKKFGINITLSELFKAYGV